MVNPEVLIGTVIDNRYRLSRTIGKGSYGWVFEATEEIAGQFVGQVAVKLLAPEDDLQRDMVLREIRALAGFTHEYIIAYRTSGQIAEGNLAGTIFLVTELGAPLDAAVVTVAEFLASPRLALDALPIHPGVVLQDGGDLFEAVVELVELLLEHRPRAPPAICEPQIELPRSATQARRPVHQ